MNLPALAFVAATLAAAIVAGPLLLWIGWCYRQPSRRTESLVILGSGIAVSGGILLLGYLAAPGPTPGLWRPWAVVLIVGYFVFGAIGGKVLHFLFSHLRGRAAV